MTNTLRFFDVVKTLESNGHPHLAMSCIHYYDNQTKNMDTRQRAEVANMFDEVLTRESQTMDDIYATEILLSPDFVFLKALARTLQTLDLVDGIDIEIELTPNDIAK